MITQWDFYNEAGFTAYAPGGVNASDNSGTELGLDTTLSWGSPGHRSGATRRGNPTGEQSRLVSNGNASGTAITNGGPSFGVTLTHHNFTVWDDGSILESATLQSVLWLTPVDPAGDALDPLGVFFDIAFLETQNETDPGEFCDDGTPNGVGVNVNGCADIFVVTNPGVLETNFELNGYLYTLNIGGVGLGPLSNSACASVGQADQCIGFLTVEQQTNVLNPFFTISASAVPTQVPVPATVMLFGIGLLALGAAHRRRHA
jgi:hypothetical protein